MNRELNSVTMIMILFIIIVIICYWIARFLNNGEFDIEKNGTSKYLKKIVLIVIVSIIMTIICGSALNIINVF